MVSEKFWTAHHCKRSSPGSAIGSIRKRRGSGTFVSDGRLQLALRERRRIIEQRIDALLAEAHQLNFTADDILRMVRERKAVMEPGTTAETAAVKNVEK